MKIFQKFYDDDTNSTTLLPHSLCRVHGDVNAIAEGTADDQRVGRWTITRKIHIEQQVIWAAGEHPTETSRLQPNWVRSYLFLDTQPTAAEPNPKDIWAHDEEGIWAYEIHALRNRLNRTRFVLLDQWDTDLNMKAVYTKWENNVLESLWIRKYNTRDINTNFTTYYEKGTTTPTSNRLLIVTKYWSCDQEQALAIDTNVELEYDDGATTTFYGVER